MSLLLSSLCMVFPELHRNWSSAMDDEEFRENAEWLAQYQHKQRQKQSSPLVNAVGWILFAVMLLLLIWGFLFLFA